MKMMTAAGVGIVLDGPSDVHASWTEEFKLFDDFSVFLLETSVTKGWVENIVVGFGEVC